MQTLDFLDKKSLRDDIPAFGPGDTLNVHVKIVEGKNHRIQVFKGFVVGRQGAGVRETFTVRKVSSMICMGQVRCFSLSRYQLTVWQPMTHALS